MLTKAFPKEAAFQFTEQEISYFQNFYALLYPRRQAAQHMQSAMRYLERHVCEAASSMPTKPRDFEFNFDWDGNGPASFKSQGLERCLSEV